MNRFVTAPLMQLWDKALNVGKLSPEIYFTRICTKYYIWQSVYPSGKIIILWFPYPWTSISNITKNRMLYIYYICFKQSFVNKNKVLFSVLKSCRNEHCRNMDIFHYKFQLNRTRVYNFEMRHPHCVSNKPNYKLYAYMAKHNYVLGDMLFTIRKAQLHVSAINVGHLQVVQWKRISRIYTHIPLHAIHPLQMQVYPTYTFSLYNLKMANIYGRNM